MGDSNGRVRGLESVPSKKEAPETQNAKEVAASSELSFAVGKREDAEPN